MAYIFGSIWDRFNRNALNALSKSVDQQGKSIQELVAKGQLTPSQYATLIQAVNGLISKGDVSFDDIDLNNGKLLPKHASEELLRMIAGDAPINAVPANGSITDIKLANKAVDRDKLKDRYSVNEDLPVGYDLNLINKEGVHTGVANGNYVNAPNKHINSNHFIIRSTPAYKNSARWMIQEFYELGNTVLFWRRWVDTWNQYYNDWVSQNPIEKNSIGRDLLSDNFYLNLMISDGEDLNNAIKQGNYLAMPGALNAPIENKVFTVKTDIYKTSLNGRYWLTQIATTADGEVESYIRRRYETNQFSEWVKMTNDEYGGTGASKFNGKNIVAFGDSITEAGDYPNKVAQMTGANVTSIGFGGCRMARVSANNYGSMSMVKISEYISTGDFTELENAAQALFEDSGDDNRPQVNRLKNINFNEVDYITILHGTNDYGAKTPLGIDSDTTYDTFKGAVNSTIENIMSAYPNIKVLFLTPFYRDRNNPGDGLNTDDNPNGDGIYMTEYVDAIVKRANAQHIPVIDLYKESGFNKYNQSHFFRDGLHPNSTGDTQLAHKVVAGLSAKY